MRFLNMDFFLSLMITFFVLSILSQILIGVLYQHMIEEAENMQNTTNKLLLQLKQRYINSYALNDGVTNVPVFVDKFINRLQLGKISLNTLKGCSGQCMLLSVSAAGVGICKGLMEGDAFISLFPYYIISFLGLYLYFSVLSIMDIPSRKNMLKTNLVDYLENHMAARLEAMAAFSATELEASELEMSDSEVAEGKTPELKVPAPKIRETMPGNKPQEVPRNLDWVGSEKKDVAERPYLSEEQEKELTELLRDFFA